MPYNPSVLIGDKHFLERQDVAVRAATLVIEVSEDGKFTVIKDRDYFLQGENPTQENIGDIIRVYLLPEDNRDKVNQMFDILSEAIVKRYREEYNADN